MLSGMGSALCSGKKDAVAYYMKAFTEQYPMQATDFITGFKWPDPTADVGPNDLSSHLCDSEAYPTLKRAVATFERNFWVLVSLPQDPPGRLANYDVERVTQSEWTIHAKREFSGRCFIPSASRRKALGENGMAHVHWSFWRAFCCNILSASNCQDLLAHYSRACTTLEEAGFPKLVQDSGVWVRTGGGNGSEGERMETGSENGECIK